MATGNQHYFFFYDDGIMRLRVSSFGFWFGPHRILLLRQQLVPADFKVSIQLIEGS
jgi:hypothetical protein